MLKQIINAKNKLISETEQSNVTQCWEAFLFSAILRVHSLLYVHIFHIVGSRYPRFNPTAYVEERERKRRESQRKQ